MFTPLKFQQHGGSRVFFTSDLHVYHDKSFVYASRGYESVDSHANHVLEIVNNTVGANDILFLLGDTFLTTTPERAEEFIQNVKCKTIYYICGNHESPIKNLYHKWLGAQEVQDSIVTLSNKDIIFLGRHAEIVVDRQFIVLNHFPLSVFNNSKFGSWMLHGHCHKSLESSLPDANEGKILDVGWDVFKKPMAFDEIKSIMRKKEIKSKDGLH